MLGRYNSIGVIVFLRNEAFLSPEMQKYKSVYCTKYVNKTFICGQEFKKK